MRRVNTTPQSPPYAFVAVVLVMCSWAAIAQELTPAAYTPAPKGINYVTVVASYSGGELTLDPSLPVDDVTADIFSSALGYARTFVSLAVPQTSE